jgi:hypothetical protein
MTGNDKRFSISQNPNSGQDTVRPFDEALAFAAFLREHLQGFRRNSFFKQAGIPLWMTVLYMISHCVKSELVTWTAL